MRFAHKASPSGAKLTNLIETVQLWRRITRSSLSWVDEAPAKAGRLVSYRPDHDENHPQAHSQGENVPLQLSTKTILSGHAKTLGSQSRHRCCSRSEEHTS